MSVLKKSKKPLKPILDANEKLGYLDKKTIKAREKFSQHVSLS